MIFHCDFSNKQLSDFLENLGKADPYFAHLYYWYINSLSLASNDIKWKIYFFLANLLKRTQKIITSILDICSREAETQVFLRDYQKFYTILQKRLPIGSLTP